MGADPNQGTMPHPDSLPVSKHQRLRNFQPNTQPGFIQNTNTMNTLNAQSRSRARDIRIILASLFTLTLTAVVASAQTMPVMPVVEDTDLRTQTVQFSADYYRSFTDFELPADDADITRQEIDEREGDLLGFTATYGPTTNLFFDFSYYTGETEGAFREDFTAASGLQGVYLVNDLEFDDTWMEFRVRYIPNAFVGKDFQAYIAAGITSVKSDSTYYTDVYTPDNTGATYSNVSLEGEEDSLFASIGGGVAWKKALSASLHGGLKAEGAFLLGEKDVETTLFDPITGDRYPDDQQEADEDGTVQGFVGRASLFAIMPITSDNFTGAFSVEGGLRYYYIDTNNDNIDQIKDWGPFVKAGFSIYF